MRAPVAQDINHPLQVAPSSSKAVLYPSAAFGCAPIRHSRVHQQTQPLSKEGPRDARQPAFQFIEVIHVGQQFADNQQGPLVGQNSAALATGQYWP